MNNDTICAISTSQGNGAIALLRLSGENALQIANKIFISHKKDFSLLNQSSHTVVFGDIIYANQVIDEVLVSVFKSPNTFTGEDVVEISCHGSVYIQQQILQLLIKNGARLAKPGEFTQRAYLNGKMDLSQAEAVADLISASSKMAHNIAINQMRGGVSNELAVLRAELLQFISLIELELDFSEEDVEFANREQLLHLTNKIKTVLDRLIKSFELGNAIKNGVPVAIIGEPNVGKSTLLNAILKDDKAIVSDIAGTTRDTVEDIYNYNGITFRFIDTAGLRKTSDTIESLGIDRTYKKMEQAKIVLALFDANNSEAKIKSELNNIFERAGSHKKVVLVRNKSDISDTLPPNIDFPKLEAQLNISAKNNVNIDALLQILEKSVLTDSYDNSQVVVSNIRHLEALEQALEALMRAENGIKQGVSNDFLAMDIREVIHHLSGITGNEITTEEVLGNIFGQFCIGK